MERFINEHPIFGFSLVLGFYVLASIMEQLI